MEENVIWAYRHTVWQRWVGSRGCRRIRSFLACWCTDVRRWRHPRDTRSRLQSKTRDVFSNQERVKVTYPGIAVGWMSVGSHRHIWEDSGSCRSSWRNPPSPRTGSSRTRRYLIEQEKTISLDLKLDIWNMHCRPTRRVLHMYNAMFSMTIITLGIW